MSFQSNRARDRRGLERELASRQYVEIFENIITYVPELADQPDCLTLAQHAARLPGGDPTKQALLLHLVAQYQTHGDGRALQVLLVIMWPAMEAVFVKKQRRDREHEALWSAVVGSFLLATAALNIGRRKERIAARLVNETFHRLNESYAPAMEAADHEVYAALSDPDGEPSSKSYIAHLESLTGGDADPAFEAVNQRFDDSAYCRALTRLRAAGRLTADEHYLLVMSRVFRRLLADAAAERGLTHENAKKLCRRAEVRLRLDRPKK